MISDEAVEAAAKELLRIVRPAHPNWDEWAEDGRDMYRSQAGAILEAAAPHIIRQAKADGWDEGYQGCYDRYMYEPVPSNPYRSQA